MAVTCEAGQCHAGLGENRIKPIQTPINAEDGTNLVMGLPTKVVGPSDGQGRRRRKEEEVQPCVHTQVRGREYVPQLTRSMQTLVPRPACFRALRTEP